MTCIRLSRRSVIRLGLSAGAGLYLGVSLPTSATEATKDAAKGVLQPSAFLALDEEGFLTVWVSRQEMGQGARTVIPMIIADEMDADWSKVRLIQAPLDEKYGVQRTGGSLTVRELWEPLRQTGATARQMLLDVASRKSGVALDELETRDGFVINRLTGERTPYGSLAVEASASAVPAVETLRLKSPDEFRLIGRDVKRLDGEAIVRGEAVYGADVTMPGMLYASFERCPVIGGTVKSFDASKAKRVPGVVDVVPISGEISWMTQWANGVAVVAESTWAALAGREKLEIEWDEGEWADLDTEKIRTELIEHAARQGTITRDDGDVASALAREELRSVDVEYEAPYLSHSPLEPMNATVSVTEDSCEIFAPVQFPSFALAIAAKITGLPPEKIHVQPTLIGGGFGRRIYADYVGEAVMIAKAVGKPVQLLWTRVDDTRHGFYRPWSYHRMSGVVTDDGKVAGWQHRIAGPSRDATSNPSVDTPERSEVYTAVEMPYDVENVRVEFSHRYLPLPAGPWRAVSYSQGGFVIESFIDELAAAAGADPIKFRLNHLGGKPFSNRDTLVEPQRMKKVLEIAAERVKWKQWRRAPGRGRGVAVTMDHGSVVVHIAEVRSSGTDLKVERFTSVIDCGLAVNPDMVRAQVEGAIAFALSATLWGEITLKKGRVEQSSYADYPVVMFRDMPEVDVFIVPSTDAPGGVGEPPLPGVAPAVTNALFDATGIRIRRLPIIPSLERAHAALADEAAS